MKINKIKKIMALILICSLMLDINSLIYAGTAATGQTLNVASVSLDIAFPSGKSVVYNGKKHMSGFVWKGKDNIPSVKKNTVCDLVFRINSPALDFAEPKIKVKNNKNVATSEKKLPCIILGFKASGDATPEQKALVKDVNKELKKSPVYFNIEPADLNDLKPVVTLNKNASKVKKVVVTLGDKQVKLSKKDYQSTISGNTYTITGIRNYKGTFTNDPNKKKDDDPEPQVDAKDTGIRKNLNAVNLDLLKTAKISADIKAGKNLAISSYSIENAMGMAANGAKGETLSEIEKALFDGASIGKFNEDIGACSDHLRSLSGNGFTTNLANGIWVNGLEVEDDFRKNVETYYSASINCARFTEKSGDEINSFVAENTHDMIKKIVDDLDQDVRAVLVNALYMEGKWDVPFDDEHIKENADFTNSKGGTEKVTRLIDHENSTYFRYKKGDGIIRDLTEGKGKFIAILPDKGVSLTDYLAECDADMMAGIEANISHKYELTTEFPEFEYEYEAHLNEPLSQMGIKHAFRNADFTNMLKDKKELLYIDSVIHKTHVKVDRTGAKAAAATAIFEKATSVGNTPPRKYVIFDRPFIYMLTDDNYMPLFIGVVNTCK